MSNKSGEGVDILVFAVQDLRQKGFQFFAVE